MSQRAPIDTAYGDPTVYRQHDPAQVDSDGYPPAWHHVKHQVREQAGSRCVRCGHPYRNGEYGSGEWTPCDERCIHGGSVRCSRYGFIDVERAQVAQALAAHFKACDARHAAQWRILTVHHLNGDKCDLRWWNLVALCQRCHLEIQGRVVMDRVWPYEHSAWFRPYVAGYYAWRYLGEHISREEAEQRMDELLALEVRQLSLDDPPVRVPERGHG